MSEDLRAALIAEIDARLEEITQRAHAALDRLFELQRVPMEQRQELRQKLIDRMARE